MASINQQIAKSLASACLILAFAASIASPIFCKPLGSSRFKNAAAIDPLVAMPSEDQHVIYSQAPTTVQYILQPQAQAQQTTTYVAAEPKSETHYVLSSETQMAQAEPQHQHGRDCEHKQEYLSLAGMSNAGEPSRDYPGEILYIGQNNEVLGVGKDQPSSQELPELADSIAQSSGMPATILTEVPAREMPYHVLEKLKREYGVKVVATRERPGANLVINCDEPSQNEASICARQAPSSPYAYVAPEAEAVQAGGYPVGEHTQALGPDSHEPRTEITYVTEQESPRGESHEDSVYGARNSASVGEQQSAAPEAHPEGEVRAEGEASGSPAGATAQEGEAHSQAEADQHQQEGGFEEQPKSSEEETKQNASDYNNASQQQ